jgi:hypothetical protein
MKTETYTPAFIQLPYQKSKIAAEINLICKVVKESEAAYLSTIPQIPAEIIGKRHFRIDNNPAI